MILCCRRRHLARRLRAHRGMTVNSSPRWDAAVGSTGHTPGHDLRWARRGCFVVIDLRDVAAPPWEEDLLVTARPKGVVDVWSLVRGARCATFETV